MPSDGNKVKDKYGFPPILPDLRQQLEEYLTRPDNLPIHNKKTDFKIWDRKIDFNSLLFAEISPVTTTLKVDRDLSSGELLNFREIPVTGIGQTTKNSSSFSRPPSKATDDVRGNRANYPFWPGGFDSPSFQEFDEINFNVDFENDLSTKAPGMSRGYEFTKPKETIDEKKNNSDIIDLRTLVDTTDYDLWSLDIESKTANSRNQNIPDSFKEMEENIIPKDVKIPVKKMSNSNPLKTVTKTEWAELLDTNKPVVDFHKKIPDPAVTWNFELDTFQKLAVLKLEDHKHIFVAAHTSAGKTVVAEYAIGLSERHCTKAIYTSPIKALSNQKYRDFKHKFNEVGLITGDYQVNQTASCLIMTTEILRSMLYAGSDVIRDLEFVIFDEVHYINDSERGHVWEEILIMLPSTVCIVMLSATVPNVLEFADWVGSIKRAKMYVVQTLKRPVPLQHYLYTGGNSKIHNFFLIKDGEGPFIKAEYDKALDFFNSGSSKGDKKIPKLEKTYWQAFAYFLERNNKLPAVAFILSRSKCDRYAEFLMNIDLTTSKEKAYINCYFKECIKTLKSEDQNLPQITKMGALLNQGIAVHHSGILPILKEIVEILFQRSYVKLLFATETFAMGVNMPARTVAFDSIKKFDGSVTRNLEPHEYIQMAGRAGRRGQDDTGTVIILCKHDICGDWDLKNMIWGNPTHLRSQFKVTYSMILNLLRVKGMRVEDIMSHSFKEIHNRRKNNQYQKELKELEDDLNKNSEKIKSLSNFDVLDDFFLKVQSFINYWDDYCESIFNPNVQKKLTPGRFIVISYKQYMNRLALILKILPKRQPIEYRVLILSDSNDNQDNKEVDSYYRMLSYSKNRIFVPNCRAIDLILNITSYSIKDITKFQIKIETDLVISDWEKRQIERFRNDPPSKTCFRAINELSEKSDLILSSENPSEHYISLLEPNVKEVVLYNNISGIQKDKEYLSMCKIAEEIPDFDSLFGLFFDYKQKEMKLSDLRFKLSDRSLLSYEEYENKINTLRTLKYINEEDIVEMKGKVACEMGSNELIITELIFQGTLSKYEPAEIAALLSCLVFQVKLERKENLELTDSLKEGIQTIKTTYNQIYRRSFDEQYEYQELNFGLVEVVYEWAQGKVFSQIMELIDEKVQEGIIVRCIQQLNEILCDIKNAAKLFGDLVLKKKMEEASEAIKRDIVFAASLYTQD